MNGPRELGDLLESALSTLGLTPERAQGFLQRLGAGQDVDCGCEDRKQRLNAVSGWCRRVLRGMKDRALEHLENLLE